LRSKNSFGRSAYFSQTPSQLVALFNAAYTFPGGFEYLSLKMLIFRLRLTEAGSKTRYL
jgi:hypothetical protein